MTKNSPDKFTLYLTSETLGNLTDFGFKCRYCNTINRITIEELKKREYFQFVTSVHYIYSVGD